MSKAKQNYGLDAAILLAFLLNAVSGFCLWLATPHTHGAALLGIDRSAWITMHILAGLAGLAGVILHIVWHWDWLKALRDRQTRRLPQKLRANRIVNRVMWITYLTAIVFGLLSWAMDWTQASYVVSPATRLHVAFSIVWVTLTVAHLALHWKWVVSTTQRVVQAAS